MRRPRPYRSHPPESRLDAVKRRGRTLRRRRQLFLVSAPLVVLVGVGAAGIALQDDGVRVVSADGGTTTSTGPPRTPSTTGAPPAGAPTTLVPAPTTSTTSSPGTSSPGTSTTAAPTPETTTTAVPVEPADLLARIELSSTTVVAGGTVAGELVVENRTGGPVELLDRECRPNWTVGLVGADGVTHEVAFPAICHPEPLTFPPGLTRLPFAVAATYHQCTPSPPPGSGALPCLPPPDIMPPLPPGRYEAKLVGTSPSLTAAPVPVEVVTG